MSGSKKRCTAQNFCDNEILMGRIGLLSRIRVNLLLRRVLLMKRENLMRIATLIAASTLALAGVPAHAVAIVNGSFEGTNPSNSFDTVSSLQGWNVGGTVDLIGSYWTAQDGNNSIDLSGNGPATLSQTVNGLAAGTSYVVSFFISGNPDNQGNTPATKTATLTLGGSSFPVSYTVIGSNSSSNMQWQQVSYTFLAGSSSALLSLAGSPANGPYGLAVDNFSIAAAVPEPASWLMMILGFGLVGAGLRRRRGLGTLAAA
jgi:Protein of unknown function (DUF642)/PEP-CTERM motif